MRMERTGGLAFSKHGPLKKSDGTKKQNKANSKGADRLSGGRLLTGHAGKPLCCEGLRLVELR